MTRCGVLFRGISKEADLMGLIGDLCKHVANIRWAIGTCICSSAFAIAQLLAIASPIHAPFDCA